MGQKGGSSNQTSTTQSSSSPPPQVMADYQALVNRATNQANVPYQQYSGEEVAPLSNQTVAGLGNVNQYANSSQPAFQAAEGATMAAANPIQAQQYSGQAINGYMSPYTQDVVNSTQNQFNNQNDQSAQFLNSQNISSGAFGGDRAGVSQAILANQQQSAQAPVIAGLYNTAYNNAQSEFNTQQGVNLQQQAFNNQQLGQMGAQLGSLGTAQQGAGLQGAMAQIQAGEIPQQEQQAIDTALYNQYQQQQSYPYQTTGWLGNLIEGTGSLSGGTSSSQTSSPVGNSTSSALGAGLSGLGILGSFLSDARAKEDITPVGKTFDGQTIYRYRYKGDPRTQIGLIAQETERHHPDAVHEQGGLKGVDYDRATRHAAQRGHFALGGATQPQQLDTLPAVGQQASVMGQLGDPGARAGMGMIGLTDNRAQSAGATRPGFGGGGTTVDMTSTPYAGEIDGVPQLAGVAGISNNLYSQITQGSQNPVDSFDPNIAAAIGGNQVPDLSTPMHQQPGAAQNYPAIDWQQPGNDFQTAGAEASLYGLENRPGLETSPSESNPAPAALPTYSGQGGGSGAGLGSIAQGGTLAPNTLSSLGISPNNAFAQGANNNFLNSLAGNGGVGAPGGGGGGGQAGTSPNTPRAAPTPAATPAAAAPGVDPNFAQENGWLTSHGQPAQLASSQSEGTLGPQTQDALAAAIAAGTAIAGKARGGRAGFADGGSLDLSGDPYGGVPQAPTSPNTPRANPTVASMATAAPSGGTTGPATLQQLYGSAPGASALNPSGNGALMAANWGGFTGPGGIINQDDALQGIPSGGNQLMNPGSFATFGGDGGVSNAIANGAPKARGGPVARAYRASGGQLGQSGMGAALSQAPQASMVNNGGGFSSMFGDDPGKGGASRPTFAQGGSSSDPAIGPNPWESNGAGWVPIVQDPVSGHGPPQPSGGGANPGGGGGAAQSGSSSLQSGIKQLGDLAKKTGILGGSPAAAGAGAAGGTSADGSVNVPDGDVNSDIMNGFSGDNISSAASDMDMGGVGASLDPSNIDLGDSLSDLAGMFARGGGVMGRGRRHFDAGGDVPDIDSSVTANPVPDPNAQLGPADSPALYPALAFNQGDRIDPPAPDAQVAQTPGNAGPEAVGKPDMAMPIGSKAPAIPPPRPDDATLGGKTPSTPSPATPATPSSIKVGQALAPTPVPGAVGPQSGNARGAPVALTPGGGAAPMPAPQMARAPGAAPLPQRGVMAPVGTTGALAPVGSAGGSVKGMVFNGLTKAGVPPQAALGALYSLAGESGAGLNTNAFNPKDPGGSYGIGQWNGVRRQALNAFAQQHGLSPNDPQAQVGYLMDEVTNPRSPTYQPGVLAALQRAPSAQAATQIWTKMFERPTVDNSAARYAMGSRTIGTLDQNGQIVGGGQSAKLTGAPDASGASDLGPIGGGQSANMPSQNAQEVQAQVQGFQGPDGQPFFKPGDQSNPFSANRPLFNAMMYAGFAMMGGESRNPWVNIGRGAMAGQEYMQKQGQLDRDWAEKQAQINHLGHEDRRADVATELEQQKMQIEWKKYQLGADAAKRLQDVDTDDGSGSGGGALASAPAAPAAASGPPRAASTVAPIAAPGSTIPPSATAYAPAASPQGGAGAPAGGPSAPSAAAAPASADAAPAAPQGGQPAAQFDWNSVIPEDNPQHWRKIAAIYDSQAGIDPNARAQAMAAREQAAKAAQLETVRLKNGQSIPAPGMAQAKGAIAGGEEAGRINARRGEPFDAFVQGPNGWQKERVIDPNQIREYAAKGTIGGQPVRTDEPPELAGQAAGAKETATQQAQVNPDVAAGRARMKGQEEMAAGTAKQVLDEDKLAGDQSHGLNQQNQRLEAMKTIMQHWQPGGIAENLAQIRNVARSFNIPVNDPSSAFEFMKNSTGEVFDALKDQKGAVRNLEITGLSKSNPSPNIPSEANAAMIAQLQGVIKQRQDFYNEYADWRKGEGAKGDQSPELFAQRWEKAHPIGDYVKQAKHNIAYQGQQIGKDDGQLYQMPDGRQARYNATKKGYSVEAAPGG